MKEQSSTVQQVNTNNPVRDTSPYSGPPGHPRRAPDHCEFLGDTGLGLPRYCRGVWANKVGKSIRGLHKIYGIFREEPKAGKGRDQG